MHDNHRLAFLLICAALMLTAVGIIEIYAASATRAMEQFNDPYLFLRKHVLVAALCVPLIFFSARPTAQVSGLGNATAVFC